MRTLRLPKPVSAGIILSYKCPCTCKHCMYACAPEWASDWISNDDLDHILRHLASTIQGNPDMPSLGINVGLHFTGGEPFLNYPLLLEAVSKARYYRIPARFVETNGFWCTSESRVKTQLLQLREAGLDGVLISVNPFVIEHVPFRRIEQAIDITQKLFGQGLMIYQHYFYQVFHRLGLQDTLSFQEYLRLDPRGLRHIELLPRGRAVYSLSSLFPTYPACHFFGQSCRYELTRDWHIHIDNYGNYIPGYCGGISLGDVRQFDQLFEYGLDLAQFPVLAALVTDLSQLYRLGVQEYGYKERIEGYISKCHLCVDIRAHIVTQTSQYRELQPRAYYHFLFN